MSAAERGSVDGAEAGNRLDDRVAAREFGVGSDAVAEAAVAVGDVGLEGLERGTGAAGGLGVEFGEELAESAELLDELATESEQVAEQPEVASLWRGAVKAVEEAEAGEHGGIDAVVLGELADGFGEAPGAQGIDHDGVEASVGEALVEVAVVAPSGLEDGAGDAVFEQPVAQGAAAGLGVVELPVEVALVDVGVEFRLADIDAGDDNGGGSWSFLRTYPFAIRVCTHASVQGAQELLRRADQANKRVCQPEVRNGPARRRRGAWPGTPTASPR